MYSVQNVKILHQSCLIFLAQKKSCTLRYNRELKPASRQLFILINAFTLHLLAKGMDKENGWHQSHCPLKKVFLVPTIVLKLSLLDLSRHVLTLILYTSIYK